MLPGVGMVQMYSKLVIVNDLGYVWTVWPSSLHGPALLLVPTVYLPSGLPRLLEAHCTIPTSALVFGGQFFTHPCFLIFYGMQISDGQRLVYLKGFQTTVATNESMCPKCMAGCVAHYGMWLGGHRIYYFCLDRLSFCRVRCDTARTAEQGARGCSPQKLLASGNHGSRQDWLGHGVYNTHNPNHISLSL